VVCLSSGDILGFSMGGEELPIDSSNFQFFKLYENINIDFPIAELSFIDTYGSIMEVLSFVGGEVIKVDYSVRGGSGSFDLVVGALYPSMVSGGTNSVLIYLHWLRYSDSLQSFGGGFSGSVSGIAKRIAETLGASAYDIEEVITELNFVAAGVPFVSSLQYLAEVAKGGYSGFAWFWDKEDVFHFRSIASFFEQPIFRTVDLRYGNDSSLEQADLVYGLQFENMARGEPLRGFRGISGMFFNWETNQFVLSQAIPSEADRFPLANRFLVRRNEETAGAFNMGWLGRSDPQYPADLHKNYVEGYLLDRLNWAVRIALHLRGDWGYRLGQVIEVIRPSAVPERAFDIQSSGSWMIEGIVHLFTGGEGYAGQLQLIRNGVNLRDEAEFVR